MAPEPITITLTGVTTGLTMVWDAEDTVWLLPAYTFTDDQQGQYQVIAIDDAFIELPEALPVAEPLPADVVAHDWGDGLVYFSAAEAGARGLAYQPA